MDKRRYYQNAAVAGAYEQQRVRSSAGQLTQDIELAALRSTFRRDEHVIELACGTGRLLRALRAEGWTVKGIDQSKAMLDAGGLKIGEEALTGDVFHLPLADQSIDGAYCFRFTNHYPDLSDLFSECRRVLKPGGHLLFDTMSWSPLSRIPFYPGGKNYPVGEARIRRQLEQAGFRVQSVDPLFPVGPYLLARLPTGLTRRILELRGRWPRAWQAVLIWHVYRTA